MTARDLHALLAHAADPRPDADLLHDPAGFPEVVRRHGPLVWATCRRLSPEPADAFQAVFLALTRSAKRIRTPAALAGWLHAASVRVCLQQRRTVARRRLREKRAARPEADIPVADSAWDRILMAAHEEIARLPPHERTAFVLCELQGVPAGVAAKQLGWKPGTLTGRLSKARARLLANLSARGLAPAVGLTVGGAVPAEVLALGVKCVGPAATVPAGVLALSTEVTAMVGLKHLAACVLVASGLAVGGGGMVLRANGDEPTLPKVTVSPPLKVTVSPPPVVTQVLPPLAYLGPLRPADERPQWEHQTVTKPGSLSEFEKLLTTRGTDGWEFAGTVSWPAAAHDGVGGAPPLRPSEVVVFKRPAGGPAVATPPQPTVAPARQFGSASPDPEAIWNYLAKGEKSINLNDPAHTRTKERMVRDGTPIPADGVLTKEQFVAYFLRRLPMTQPPAAVGGFQAIPLKHAKAADVARTVRELLAPPPGPTIGNAFVVSADEQRNLVLYRLPAFGDPKGLEKEVRKLVAELDVPAK